MKRILLIGETPLMASHFGTIIRHLGFHLQNNGFEIACLGFNYSGWPFKSDLINYPLYPWVGPPQKPFNIETVLSEFKPDTLLFIGPPILFVWLKEFKDREKYTKILITAFRSSPLSSFMKDIYQQVDKIIVNSRYEETILKSELPGSLVSYIPPGINTEELVIPKHSKYFSDNRFRVACVAKDIPQIDFPSLMKAFGIVSKADQNIMFGIFSDAGQFGKWDMRDMLDVYGIQERCSIIPENPEMNFGFHHKGELYRTIDLLVLPHQEETINIPAIEALYCNVPIILSKGGPTAEFIGESRKVTWLEHNDLFIAPPNNTRYMVCDAHEIADKIILGFLEFSKAKGNTNNRKTQKSFERFDWKKVTRDWINVLK